MAQNWLHQLPEHCQLAAAEAVSSAFGSTAVQAAEPVPGGASGAVTYRLSLDDRLYLLRIETRRGPLRNPHQYECLRIASAAGVAPALHYFNDAAGTAIMDFIAAKPLHTYTGGVPALVRALGELTARLQATTPFPVLGDFRAFLARMLEHLRARFAPGLLNEHMESFERIRSVYPWDAGRHVSSHNDPNPNNILFDGERLWLIDWETAYRNDAFTDIAILTENHARSPELEGLLLTAWLGHEPDRLIQAKVRLMRQMTRLYYAALLIGLAGKLTEPIADLTAPTIDEFRARMARRELDPMAIETRLLLGKMCLDAMRAETRSPQFAEALQVCERAL